MNKAEQKLNEVIDEFIEKNLKKEREKYSLGKKHNLYQWEELKDNLKYSANEISDLREKVKVYQEFLKEMGYQTTFRQWINNKN